MEGPVKLAHIKADKDIKYRIKLMVSVLASIDVNTICWEFFISKLKQLEKSDVCQYLCIRS